ncbi:uncharacterized protein PHACADRAFT_162541 [Phanerochaete carnosa HHB-10118-sp]|uniref:NADP-dependent oxidoreductase domain-containing protein n=1 Tax=Phanerochaete carnosa (strain HHB-10118-sp) TaxID=650164 RepID=K5UVV3_PHACS|nr:uncharacterized protein PHACADRAFT_162541 [Phanerochaete carnosa HHB-10118-sp]EKM54166.1 hypothetical protein PHACADRAFT_162541 [Phanerochaete carnosa HHB-10118-sp]
MPVLGLGVYQNYDTELCVLDAFRAGSSTTAQAYRNEADVGFAVAESGLAREDVFISYVDLFLIHNPHSGKGLRLENYSALLERRDAGDIRSVGVSNYGIKHLEEICEAGLEAPAVNQIELHPLCPQRPIVAYCKQHNIVVQAYTPLIRGRRDEPVLRQIADKHGMDIAQVLVRWSLQKGCGSPPRACAPKCARLTTQGNPGSHRSQSRRRPRAYARTRRSSSSRWTTRICGVLDALDRGAQGAVTWNAVDAD